MFGNVCSWIPNVTEFAKLDSTRVLARLERCRTSRKSAEPSGVLPPRHPVSQANTSTTYGNRPQLSRRFPVSRFCFVFFPLEPFLPFPSCFACVFFLSPHSEGEKCTSVLVDPQPRRSYGDRTPISVWGAGVFTSDLFDG